MSFNCGNSELAQVYLLIRKLGYEKLPLLEGYSVLVKKPIENDVQGWVNTHDALVSLKEQWEIKKLETKGEIK